MDATEEKKNRQITVCNTLKKDSAQRNEPKTLHFQNTDSKGQLSNFEMVSISRFHDPDDE